jgi:hypothetical protein
VRRRTTILSDELSMMQGGGGMMGRRSWMKVIGLGVKVRCGTYGGKRYDSWWVGPDGHMMSPQMGYS